jgi:hypothetical protein
MRPAIEAGLTQPDVAAKTSMRQLGSVDILRIQIEIVIQSEPRDLHFARAIPDFRLLVEARDSPAADVNRARQLPMLYCFASNSFSITRRSPLLHLKSLDTGGEKG